MVDTKNTSEATESVPSSLGAIRDIFEEFNVPDVSDEICTRVLDVIYKHTCDVIEEAKAIAKHSGHQNIEESDMRLAIESINDGLMFAPPHKAQLLAYAERNSQPLPPIRTHHGIALPMERNTLTAPNYTLVKPEPDANQTQLTSSCEPVRTTELASSLITANAAPISQGVFRLSTAATTMGPPSTVRVIAPAGICPSMIRVQSVQNLPQLSPALDSASSLRTYSMGAVSSHTPNTQRRFPDAV